MEMLVKGSQFNGAQRIKCSLNDHFVFRTPVSLLFFYQAVIPLQIIIEALQQVLSDFPIFAGRIVKEREELYIECQNQGVQLRVLNSSSFLPLNEEAHKIKITPYVEKIKPYRCLKKGSPLLTIQLNYFSDGLVIGYSWHHSIGDMATFMSFLQALSAQAQGKMYPLPMIVDDREGFLKQHFNKNSVTSTKHSDLQRLTFFDLLRLAKHLWSPKKKLYFYWNEKQLNTMREEISTQLESKVTKNAVICGFLTNLITKNRKDRLQKIRTTIVVNLRKRLDLPPNLLGNYLDAITLELNKKATLSDFAHAIHSEVKHYQRNHFNPYATGRFVQNNGGIKNIGRFIPKAFLPQYQNLIITNWSHFDVYSIDFGIAPPTLFLPAETAPFPWVACIVEGYKNQGALVSLTVPAKYAKKIDFLHIA